MYSLSERLIHAVENLSAREFSKFLVGWREELEHILRTDPSGFIGHKCKAAATKLDAHFPNREVLLGYLKPITSWSANVASVATIPTLCLRQPDLEGLASFCFRRFEWSPAVIHEKFESLIWPGATLRMLCQVGTIGIRAIFYLLTYILPSSPRHVTSCLISGRRMWSGSFDVKYTLYPSTPSLSTEDAFKAVPSQLRRSRASIKHSKLIEVPPIVLPPASRNLTHASMSRSHWRLYVTPCHCSSSLRMECQYVPAVFLHCIATHTD